MADRVCCVFCDRVVRENQHAVECSKCCSWVHKGCSGLTDREFDKVHALSRKTGSHGWECMSCKKSEVKRASLGYARGSNSADSDSTMGRGTPGNAQQSKNKLPSNGALSTTENQVKDEISNLSKKTNVTNRDIFALVTKMLNLLVEQRNDIHRILENMRVSHQHKIDNLEKEVAELRENLQRQDKINRDPIHVAGEITDEMYSENLYREIQDRAVRAKNVIVHGVPESQSQDTKERISHDCAQITEILNQINVSNQEFKAVRLGKPQNRTRPLKVIFDDEKTVSCCLRNRRQLLKDSDIKIKADLTVKQREQIKKAYLELEERKKYGEKDLSVRFIKGMPRVITKNMKSGSKNVQ